MKSKIKPILKKGNFTTIPFSSLLNTKATNNLLQERVLKMADSPNDEHIGLNVDEKLIDFLNFGALLDMILVKR